MGTGFLSFVVVILHFIVFYVGILYISIFIHYINEYDIIPNTECINMVRVDYRYTGDSNRGKQSSTFHCLDRLQQYLTAP